MALAGMKKGAKAPLFNDLQTSVEVCRSLSGAGNRSRTDDLNLGKVALYQLSYSRVFWRRDPESNRARRICNPLHNRFAIAPKFGAGKRSRTVDLNLGKVALYQLSYSRKQPAATNEVLVLVFHNYKIAKTATITFFSI